jgi:hypothetical protein
MGYRSTVAYTIRFIPPQKDEPEKGLTAENCKATFFTFLAEAKVGEDTAGAFIDEDLEVEINEDNLAIYFYASDVKWYPDYEDVKCHEALLDLSREWADDGDCSNPYIGGAVARIGESMDDNVEECWGQGDYDWISINRYMYCDWKE